jgi:hypothetical protein
VATDPFDESEGIKYTEFAMRALNGVRVGNPSIAAALMVAIQAHLSAWSPGDEDGDVIRHAVLISKDCCHNVYRLKYERHGPLVERRWRVFFAFLPHRKPPARLVLAVVEFASHHQCYDDPSQPHRIEIRKAINERIARGETTKKK